MRSREVLIFSASYQLDSNWRNSRRITSSRVRLLPAMLMRRIDHVHTKTYLELYDWLGPEELLHQVPQGWRDDWDAADPDSFHRRTGSTCRMMNRVLCSAGVTENHSLVSEMPLSAPAHTAER